MLKLHGDTYYASATGCAFGSPEWKICMLRIELFIFFFCQLNFLELAFLCPKGTLGGI